MREGTVVEGIEIVGVSSLGGLAKLLRRPENIRGQWFSREVLEKEEETGEEAFPDYADICGQVTVKRAMEMAAAGKHSCLLIGPAGTGKTYLAMAMAITAFKQNEVGRIILTRLPLKQGRSLDSCPETFRARSILISDLSMMLCIRSWEQRHS